MCVLSTVYCVLCVCHVCVMRVYCVCHACVLCVPCECTVMCVSCMCTVCVLCMACHVCVMCATKYILRKGRLEDNSYQLFDPDHDPLFR